MADMMSTLKGFLGDNADEKIRGAMEMLKSAGVMDEDRTQDTQNFADTVENSISTGTPETRISNGGLGGVTPEALEMMGQLKNMFDRVTSSNDSRSNLLQSLKPFMRTDRQRSIDRVTKVMNIARLSGLFK